MEAGKLNRRIEVFNGIQFVKMWAMKETITTKIFRYKFTVRYADWIYRLGTGTQIKHDDFIFELVGVEEIGRRKGLVLHAVKSGSY